MGKHVFCGHASGQGKAPGIGCVCASAGSRLCPPCVLAVCALLRGSARASHSFETNLVRGRRRSEAARRLNEDQERCRDANRRGWGRREVTERRSQAWADKRSRNGERGRKEVLENRGRWTSPDAARPVRALPDGAGGEGGAGRGGEKRESKRRGAWVARECQRGGPPGRAPGPRGAGREAGDPRGAWARGGGGGAAPAGRMGCARGCGRAGGGRGAGRGSRGALSAEGHGRSCWRWIFWALDWPML